MSDKVMRVFDVNDFDFTAEDLGDLLKAGRVKKYADIASACRARPLDRDGCANHPSILVLHGG